MNRKTLFATSCISLVTTSMVFSIRGDIEPAMSNAFHLTREQMGSIWSPAFWAFTVAIFISGAIVDIVGMRALHVLSGLGYLVGVGLVLVAPAADGPTVSIFEAPGPRLLYIGFLIMGLAQGLVEGAINPLIATLYPQEKTHKLNVLHAWWPGGLVIGGVLAFTLGVAGASWQIKLACILLPTVTYLALALTQAYPHTERVTSQVPVASMWREAARPLFLILFVSMWMTAATELGPDQWFPSVMGALTGLQGILFLVYTAGLMFVLRFFAGPLVHRFSPLGVLAGCSVLSAIGLYWLGSLSAGVSAITAFAAATVFGIGKAYFWPTMLGVTAEQFPRGGGLLINLMGGAGMLSVAVALPVMGRYFDQFGAGAALRYVAVLPVMLIFVFVALSGYFRLRGGYRPVQLTQTGASTST